MSVTPVTDNGMFKESRERSMGIESDTYRGIRYRIADDQVEARFARRRTSLMIHPPGANDNIVSPGVSTLQPVNHFIVHIRRQMPWDPLVLGRGK